MQKRLLPDERIVWCKPDDADHYEKNVFAYVALGEVRAAAVWMHADLYRVDISCVAGFVSGHIERMPSQSKS